MRAPEDVIRKPYITEKSNAEMSLGKYTFVVDTKATKIEVKLAVEKLFGVKVLKVNTMNYEGKTKRMGVHVGPRASWKKAIVSIDLDPKPDTYLAEGGKQVISNKKYKTSIEEFGVAQ